MLFVAAPLAAGGALLAGYLLDGAWSIPVLAAIAAVVALASASRWFWSGGRRSCTGDGETPAGRRAAVRGARAGAPVIIAVSSPRPLFLPAAVMGGGAGLEILQPFAVALLVGLVTSTLGRALPRPSLFAVVGGLRPTPVVGPDTPDGEPDGRGRHEHDGRHADPRQPRSHGSRRKCSDEDRSLLGDRPRSSSPGLGLAGCQAAASGSEAEEAIAAAASVEADADGGPAR